MQGLAAAVLAAPTVLASTESQGHPDRLRQEVSVVLVITATEVSEVRAEHRPATTAVLAVQTRSAVGAAAGDIQAMEMAALAVRLVLAGAVVAPVTIPLSEVKAL
jgi:hypothetical protein